MYQATEEEFLRAVRIGNANWLACRDLQAPFRGYVRISDTVPPNIIAWSHVYAYVYVSAPRGTILSEWREITKRQLARYHHDALKMESLSFASLLDASMFPPTLVRWWEHRPAHYEEMVALNLLMDPEEVLRRVENISPP